MSSSGRSTSKSRGGRAKKAADGTVQQTAASPRSLPISPSQSDSARERAQTAKQARMEKRAAEEEARGNKLRDAVNLTVANKYYDDEIGREQFTECIYSCVERALADPTLSIRAAPTTSANGISWKGSVALLDIPEQDVGTVKDALRPLVVSTWDYKGRVTVQCKDFEDTEALVNSMDAPNGCCLLMWTWPRVVSERFEVRSKVIFLNGIVPVVLNNPTSILTQLLLHIPADVTVEKSGKVKLECATVEVAKRAMTIYHKMALLGATLYVSQ